MKHISIILILLKVICISCDRNELSSKLKEGEILLDKNEAQLAHDYYTTLVNKFPLESEVYFGKSQAEYLISNYYDALTSIDKAIELDSSKSNYYVQRASIFEEISKPIMAIKDYKKAIEIDKNPFAYNGLGSILADSLRFKESILMYNIAIKLQKDAVFYNNLGYTFEKMKLSDSAIANYNKAINLDPHDPRYYYSRAISKYRVGDKSGSINDFSTAINLDSLYHESYYYRSLIFLEKGDTTKAIQDLKESFKLGNQFAKKKLTILNSVD